MLTYFTVANHYMDESLVVYLAIEMLKALEATYKIEQVHGQLSPECFQLKYPEDGTLLASYLLTIFQ